MFKIPIKLNKVIYEQSEFAKIRTPETSQPGLEFAENSWQEALLFSATLAWTFLQPSDVSQERLSVTKIGSKSYSW